MWSVLLQWSDPVAILLVNGSAAFIWKLRCHWLKWLVTETDRPYDDVIMGAKSPASRLFTQPFIQTQIKENIKASGHWPLCGEFTGDRWIPRTNGQLRGKCFHLMTSSWCNAEPRTKPKTKRSEPCWFCFKLCHSFTYCRGHYSRRWCMWVLWVLICLWGCFRIWKTEEKDPQ